MEYFTCVFPRLDCAPCPPFFVDDIYTVFINLATQSNLTTAEIESIRVKCNIDIPTTTTTTTTTTTSTTTPSTTTEPPITTTTEIETTISPSTTSTESISNTTLTKAATSPYINQTTFSSVQNTNQTSSTPFFDITNVTSTQTPNNTTFTNVTIVTQAAKEHHSELCNDMCILISATTAVCVCLILLSLTAILLKKGREESKRRSQSRSRSRSRNRFGDLPNTQLYDSIDVDIQDTASYRNSTYSTTPLRNSADMTMAPFFENPAYRRSFELRNSFYGSWYDPEATNYEYSQTMANLTRRSRSPERPLPKTPPAHDRRSSERGTQSTSRTNHVNMRQYVPKIIQNGDTPFGDNTPYSAPTVSRSVRYHSTGHSPDRTPDRVRSVQEKKRTRASNRSLPRTPLEVRPGPPAYEEVQRQRASMMHRSRSYDPHVSNDNSTGPDGGYWTIDTNNAKKRYIKNSQKDKGRSQKNRDQSVKSRIQRQEEEVWYTGNHGYGNNSLPNHHGYELRTNGSLRHNSNDQTILSSNLHGGYMTLPSPGEQARGRNRSRRRDRERSTRDQKKVPTYRPLQDEPVHAEECTSDESSSGKWRA